MQTTPKINIQKIEIWPNDLGFDCIVNGVCFEVCRDRELNRLAIWRLRKGEMTHFLRLCDGSPGCSFVREDYELARLAYGMWRDCRDQWNSHED